MEYPYTYAQARGDVYAAPVPYSEWLVVRMLDVVLSVVELLLAARFVLSLLGAGTGNAFMQWLYGLTDRLAAPFAGTFPSFSFAFGTLEWTILFAMVVYGVAGWLAIRLVSYVLASLRAGL